jgi:hypothetical protein
LIGSHANKHIPPSERKRFTGFKSMPLREFAKIIEAVGHEPLGLLSLAFLVLGSIAYRLFKAVRKPTPTEVAVLLAIIFLGFAGIALALVRASNSLSAQAAAQKRPPSYTAALKFTGQRMALQPAEVSFGKRLRAGEFWLQ